MNNPDKILNLLRDRGFEKKRLTKDIDKNIILGRLEKPKSKVRILKK